MVYLLGGGGHCKQVIDIFIEMGIPIEGIFDDNKVPVEFYRGISILSKIDENFIKNRSNDDILTTINLFCTIGDNDIRKTIVSKFPKANWINCISPSSKISPSVKIGKGNYIGSGSQILSDSVIGDFNILNEASVITHDIIIGSFNHVAPGAVICGQVIIGDLNLLGANSTILPRITIGNNVILGSGSVTNHNVFEGKYVGVPIRPLDRRNKECFTS